jgi:hypothetical protein
LFRLFCSSIIPNTYFTTLDGTRSLRWSMTHEGDWNQHPARINRNKVECCPIERVPDILRRGICEQYADNRASLPERMFHYSIFATHRVRIHCEACGGSGKRDQHKPLLDDNKCEACEGIGSSPCGCAECDEREAGKRSQPFYMGEIRSPYTCGGATNMAGER